MPSDACPERDWKEEREQGREGDGKRMWRVGSLVSKGPRYLYAYAGRKRRKI